MEMGTRSKIYNNCEKYGGGCLRLEKPAPIAYNAAPVLEAAETYLDSMAEFYEFRAKVRGRVLTAAEDERWRTLDSEASTGYWALDLVCNAVGADAAAVVNLTKAFQRHDWKAGGWAFNSQDRRACAAFRRVVQA